MFNAELKKPKYWIHIGIITLIVLLALKFIFNHDMLNLDMFWKVGVSITGADIIAHNILKLG